MISIIINNKVSPLLFKTKAEINVIAKAAKKITVVKNRLGLNIIRHCLLNPIKNPDPAIEIKTPKEKQIAKVSGFPAMIFTIENHDMMSKTIPMHTHAEKATNLSVKLSFGKQLSLASSSRFLKGK